MNIKTITSIIKTCNTAKTVAQEDIFHNQKVIEERITDSTYSQGRIDMANIVLQAIKECEENDTLNNKFVIFGCIKDSRRTINTELFAHCARCKHNNKSCELFRKEKNLIQLYKEA